MNQNRRTRRGGVVYALISNCSFHCAVLHSEGWTPCGFEGNLDSPTDWMKWFEVQLDIAQGSIPRDSFRLNLRLKLLHLRYAISGQGGLWPTGKKFFFEPVIERAAEYLRVLR